MPCQDINVGGSGVLFELNKCQRRGETASKLTLHANGTRQWQQLKRDLLQQQQQQEQQLEQQDYGLRTTAAHTADEVAIQSHKHVERGRKVSAKPA
ncbi:GD20492 [Drosophila simulans]|uniref:GD20492 n=1 Tax=Drosophila simulans TaxID=7240 RepID=B4R183_DROSI|nr:GD20492 [Drosophila simulans]